MRDVQCRSADVEAGDEAEYANHVGGWQMAYG
jgi:hypothetical protein